MFKTIILCLSLLLAGRSYSQSLDSLRLSASELPPGYTFTKTNNCISIQACTYYDNPALLETYMGKVKQKHIQNIDSKKDKGSIMYFEFADGFHGQGFIDGYLWGADKPTKEHPEQYYVQGNYLVIWSFKKGSPITKASQQKVKAILQ